MKLSALLSAVGVSGDLGSDPEVFGLRHDSRAVEPGDLFVTWSGARFDGRMFARQAIERGAVAVLADRERPAELEAAVPWLVAPDPRALLADIAAPLYGHPDRELTLVGVTGTNGKSTVVELVAAMLDAAGLACGRIGTLGYRFAGHDAAVVPGAERGPVRTSPEASEFFRLLAEMRARGARSVATEVSSHALVQGRVRGAGFDAAVFTNLTRDHLDFHRDFDDYFAAKRLLFDQLKPDGRARAVVNLEDPYGARLAAELPEAMTFGPGGLVFATQTELDGEGTRGVVRTPRGEIAFRSPLLGRYNLSNLTAAAAAGEALALPLAAIAAGIAATPPVPGRMEAVAAGQSFVAVVDYAHTDAALAAAIRSLRELTGRKVVVVFGCGGDRDPGKRPLMGKVAGDLADLAVATSDNPRSEDPLAILSAVEQGLKASGNRDYRIVPDRREAIRRAVAVASAGSGDAWAVLVAGKGHEREQIVGNQRLPFSDREALALAIRERAESEVKS